MKKVLIALALLWPSLVSAQIAPYPLGVRPPIFGLPASAVSGGGTVTSPQLLLPSGTVLLPGLAWQADPDTGWYWTSDGSTLMSINGVLTHQWGNTYYANSSNSAAIQFGAAGDTVISRGAANRFDIATGDSLYLVSGGLGVGVTPPAAGGIQSSGLISAGGSVFAAGTFVWGNRSQAASAVNGYLTLSTQDTTTGILSDQFTNNPTCATNCGTSPTLDGVDSSFTLTMGASGVPASGFVVTFSGTWAANPQCVSQMAKAGMAVGKMVLTIVTTTTTATFVTNGVAPATTDMYHVHCRLGQ